MALGTPFAVLASVKRLFVGGGRGGGGDVCCCCRCSCWGGCCHLLVVVAVAAAAGSFLFMITLFCRFCAVRVCFL